MSQKQKTQKGFGIYSAYPMYRLYYDTFCFADYILLVDHFVDRGDTSRDFRFEEFICFDYRFTA